MILVTGGAGFVGLNYIRGLLQYTDAKEIINLDSLSYPANRSVLPNSPRHVFIHGSTTDRTVLNFLLKRQPEIVINFAAEMQTDFSKKSSDKLLLTNTNSTYNLLEGIRENCPETLFIQVSTDKIYGSLAVEEHAFTENSPYKPSTPYAATKAAADCLVTAWHHAYGLRTIVTHCSNNYGLLQQHNKLIPNTVLQALQENQIAVHSDGMQTRDWIHVEDHCSALRYLTTHGQPGQTYNIGANNEQTNISVVYKICTMLDEIRPRSNGRVHSELIEFVEDRPGNLARCTVNTDRLGQLGWKPKRDFNESIKNLITLAQKTT